MKIKTSELTGDALEWVVAQIESGAGPDKAEKQWRYFGRTFHPSIDRAQGGAIIEREKISVGYQRYSSPDGTLWDAVLQPAPGGKTYLEYGPTPLIAAMRCYVASKLGDEVDVPDELILLGETK
jgi:hypothetical protein